MLTTPIHIKTIHPENPYGEVVVCGHPIISDTEPTSNDLKISLWDGLLWGKPSTDGDSKYTFKIYIDGEFHSIGNGGGSGGGVSDVSISITPGESNSYGISLISDGEAKSTFYLDSSNTIKVDYFNDHFTLTSIATWFGTDDKYLEDKESGIINEDTICFVKSEEKTYPLRKETIYVDNLYILDLTSGEYIKVVP